MAVLSNTCGRCGSAVGDGRFCQNCGGRLREPDAAEPTERGPSLDFVDVCAYRSPEPDDAHREARHKLWAQLLATARSSVPLEFSSRTNEAAAVFLRRYHGRPNTQEAYARDLADWLVWLRRAGIDPFAVTLATVESYAREPLPGGRAASPATVARRLACLSHFYRRAAYAGLVTRNPVEQAERPRIPGQSATLGISKARARKLITVARAKNPRAALLVLLMLELGLRISEAIGTDIEDVGEQGRFKVLFIKGKGQTTKATIVPLNKSLVEAIAQVTGDRTGGPLLITATGKRLTRQQAGRIIKEMGQQIGVPELHPHALRHAFVTMALDDGASLRDVQDAARHADPRTTRRYDRNRNNLERHPTHRLRIALELAPPEPGPKR